MKGRKPKPTKLKLIEGNRSKLSKEELSGENEPQPEQVMPECPDFLNDAARDEWNRIGPEIFKLGLLTRIDALPFAIYCRAVATLEEADAHIQKEGNAIQTTNGNWIQNPHTAIANKAIDQIKAFATEFGFTPSSRSRIELPESDDESIEDFLKRRAEERE